MQVAPIEQPPGCGHFGFGGSVVKVILGLINLVHSLNINDLVRIVLGKGAYYCMGRLVDFGSQFPDVAWYYAQMMLQRSMTWLSQAK